MVGRLVQGGLLLALVCFGVFVMIHAAPGMPAFLMDPSMGRGQEAAAREALGLDRPIWVQFARWGGHALRGDLGTSFEFGERVVTLLVGRARATAMLSVLALAFALAIALALGTLPAVWRSPGVETAVGVVAALALSLPTFWLGILLMIVFSVWLQVLPASGVLLTGAAAADVARAMVMPVTTLTVPLTGRLVPFVAESMRQAVRGDYVRTARAKGLSEAAVLGRHALRNALLPAVSMVGAMLPTLLGGAAIVETVFGWPGLGSLAVSAALKRDYPVIMGVTLFVSAGVIAGSLVVDLLYGVIDPRIRLR